MIDNVIFHVDVNSAFLSWEAVSRKKEFPDEVDLRDIPSAVGGDISKRHGIILAKSTPAKKYGITTGEPVTDALKKCPELVLVSPNHKLYSEMSKRFIDILCKYSDKVEKYSIDEAFVDMTGTKLLFGEPVEAAAKIQNEIFETLGFTVNIGISNNKLLAKMASDFEKPNKIHTLFPEEIKEKMWPLPVRDLFFVGRSSEAKLKNLGIHTIGDLAKTDKQILKSALKKHGEVIWQFANGESVSVVEQQKEENKVYGNSTTISFDVTDESTAKMVLLSLAENVAARLRKDGVLVEVISVSIRLNDFSQYSHQCILNHATNITSEIHEVACRLFDELWDGTPIRLLGLQTDHVKKENNGRQLSIFDNTNYEKLEKLDAAVDEVRARYGPDALSRATFLNQEKISHMTGKK